MSMKQIDSGIALFRSAVKAYLAGAIPQETLSALTGQIYFSWLNKDYNLNYPYDAVLMFDVSDLVFIRENDPARYKRVTEMLTLYARDMDHYKKVMGDKSYQLDTRPAGVSVRKD